MCVCFFLLFFQFRGNRSISPWGLCFYGSLVFKKQKRLCQQIQQNRYKIHHFCLTPSADNAMNYESQFWKLYLCHKLIFRHNRSRFSLLPLLKKWEAILHTFSCNLITLALKLLHGFVIVNHKWNYWYHGWIRTGEPIFQHGMQARGIGQNLQLGFSKEHYRVLNQKWHEG